MPTDLAASRMSAAVKTVARLVGEVDPTDERDPVVNDDRLLVVAMQWTFFRIQGAADLRSSTQLLAHRPHSAAGRPKQRQRRARPHQHTHLNPFGELGQHVTQNAYLARPRQREVSGKKPASDMDMRLRTFQLLRDPRQSVSAVDENLEQAAAAWPRLTGRPATRQGLEGIQPADPRQPTAMMSANRTTDRGPNKPIRPGDHARFASWAINEVA